MKASELANELSGRLIGDDAEIQENGLYFMLWPQSIREAKKSQNFIITTTKLAADHLDELNTSVIVIEDIYLAFVRLKELYVNFLKEDKIIHRTAHIHPSAVIYKAIIGPNVSVGANSVIGCEAFAPVGEHECKNLPSLGYVVVEENTRIGALCSIQQGLVGKTSIGKNCLIDDQVHIGHDSILSDNTIIAGQTALAGFVHVGEGATIGGQVGIAPHVRVGHHARISAKSGVHKDVKDYEVVSGNPALPHMQYLKIQAKKKKWTK